jgi:hypothetical protein
MHASGRGVGAEGMDCQGFLFKLKENNKEWKKLCTQTGGE